MDNNYKNLKLWQKAIDLTVQIYEILEDFPTEEKFILSDQMRRAVISIPSNIAEGIGRGSNKETLRFLYIARGSLFELETQMIISLRLNYLTEKIADKIFQQITDLIKMLNSLINYRNNLKPNPTNP